MPSVIERALQAALTDRFHFGQILIRKTNGSFFLSHRDYEVRTDLFFFFKQKTAYEIAKYDDAGNYRSLKTAPNLRHGWRLEVATFPELKRALDYFYPGRLAVFAAWRNGQLQATQLRETLERQSGMYRVAAKISGEQIDNVVGNFCRSDSGCLRTILWKRDQQSTIASTKLPPTKSDPLRHQTGQGKRCIPLLCQEPCNLLVADCRIVVKGESHIIDSFQNSFG